VSKPLTGLLKKGLKIPWLNRYELQIRANSRKTSLITFIVCMRLIVSTSTNAKSYTLSASKNYWAK
jgi:hypothetical protein